MQWFSATCTSTVRLDGKTAIVTGSNTGIGKETVRDFFKRGCRVLMLCRNLDKAKEATEDIKRDCQGMKGTGEIIVHRLDLSSLASIKSCAETISSTEGRINILVNNAGIFACPLSQTEDGFEMHIGTNHLGHFYLTLLLLPKIINSAPARIVNVSSKGHYYCHMDLDDLNWEKRKYNAMQAYFQSKLANVLFTKELAKRLQVANIRDVTAYSLNPGFITSQIGKHLDDTFFRGMYFMWRNVFSLFSKTPWQGAQTTIYCSVEEKVAKETGLYYNECKVVEPSEDANKMEDAKRLWDISVNLVGLNPNYDPFKERTD